jgi:choline dehydrogenase-like flavoprotein
VKHTLKQVGKNLIDNGAVFVEYETRNFSVGESIPVALVNMQSCTKNTNPDTFFILKMDHQANRLAVVIINASPKSATDIVSLYNANPLRSPKIELDYLKDQRDVKIFVDAINYVRKVLSTKAITMFASLNEIVPGMNQTDLSTYVRSTITPANHFSGTCSMGLNANDSVVNNQFKVHGVDNLRVVDASVFPRGFVSKMGPCLTIYALAEKAAHLLKGQRYV